MKKYPKQEVFRLYEQKNDKFIRIIAGKINRFVSEDERIEITIEKVKDEDNIEFIGVYVMNVSSNIAKMANMFCSGYYFGWNKSFSDETVQ